MGNQGAGDAELRDRVQELRKQAGRSTQWLADRTGIPYSTLRRRLEVAPENFTLKELHRIADALDVPVEAILIASDEDQAVSA